MNPMVNPKHALIVVCMVVALLVMRYAMLLVTMAQGGVVSAPTLELMGICLIAGLMVVIQQQRS
jgi:hypothetical protein